MCFFLQRPPLRGPFLEPHRSDQGPFRFPRSLLPQKRRRISRIAHENQRRRRFEYLQRLQDGATSLAQRPQLHRGAVDRGELRGGDETVGIRSS